MADLSSSANMTVFTLRQEHRILQTMNDSKATEIRRLQQQLRQYREHLADLYALWVQTREYFPAKGEKKMPGALHWDDNIDEDDHK